MVSCSQLTVDDVLCLYSCHSFNVHDPVIEDDVDRGEDAFTRSLLAPAH